MARAAVREFEAGVAIGVTGVAGPKPQDGIAAGRVFIAVASEGGVRTREFDFDGGPDEVKECAVGAALGLLAAHLQGEAAEW
jgi:nicotinamide-nucleotide amidase